MVGDAPIPMLVLVSELFWYQTSIGKNIKLLPILASTFMMSYNCQYVCMYTVGYMVIVVVMK